MTTPGELDSGATRLISSWVQVCHRHHVALCTSKRTDYLKICALTRRKRVSSAFGRAARRSGRRGWWQRHSPVVRLEQGTVAGHNRKALLQALLQPLHRAAPAHAQSAKPSVLRHLAYHAVGVATAHAVASAGRAGVFTRGVGCRSLREN
jgi:hypothetical protein